MTSLAFRIVNVFTQDRGTFTGNPLCVFENGSSLDDRTMQSLARQFNLSETTFILPSTQANARVRIFTPDYEMPFAGHPTLGTAFVCRSLGLGGDSLILEMKAGLIAVRADQDQWTLQARDATWRELPVPRSELANALQVDESDIGDRPLWVKAGKEQLIVPLRSEAAVRKVRPVFTAFENIIDEEGRPDAYVFAEIAPGRLLSRYFFSGAGSLMEDPATGSATANLGGWMLAMGRTLPVKVRISQGEYAGRPSTLLLNVTQDRRILVGGDVVEIGRGTIIL